MISSSKDSQMPISVDHYSSIESKISELRTLGQGNFDKKATLLTAIVDQLAQIPINETPSRFSNDFGRTMAHLRVAHSQGPLEIRKELRELSKKMESIAVNHGLQRPRPVDPSGLAKLKIAVNSVTQMRGQMLQKGESDTLLREGKILSTEYWIEFLDKWHRHPAVLNTYFNEWRSYGHCETIDFWSYLNELEQQGSIVHPDLFSEKDQVQYLTKEERETYRCAFKRNETGSEAIAANGKALEDGLYITVLGPDNEFYIATKQPGKFQHASFFRGEAVKSAGMFLIEKGVIKNFIAQSGHYKPEMPEIFHALSRMEKSGIDLSQISLLYGSGGEDKVEISDPGQWQPYIQFKKGSYKPDAVFQKEGQIDALEKLEKVTSSDRLVFNFLKNYGGAVIHKDLDVLEPVNSRDIQLEWIKFKNMIAQDIGIITPSVTKESRLWSNSASSVEELLKDASMTMPGFKAACQKIADNVKAKMSYGPNDACAVKTEESLMRKMETDAKQMGISPNESLKMIDDVLRGTVVVSDSKQIPLVIDDIKAYTAKSGGSVVLKNLWIEERATGYVGVHGKLYLPVINEKGDKIPNKMMIVELQIHLDVIMDGSPDCVKEYAHKIYEKLRTGEIDPVRINPISLSMFASALKPLADKLQMEKTQSQKSVKNM